MPPAIYDGSMADDELSAYTDRQLAELIFRAICHVDAQLHELRQDLDEYRPLLDRAAAMADTGRGWRSWRTAANRPLVERAQAMTEGRDNGG